MGPPASDAQLSWKSSTLRAFAPTWSKPFLLTAFLPSCPLHAVSPCDRCPWHPRGWSQKPSQWLASAAFPVAHHLSPLRPSSRGTLSISVHLLHGSAYLLCLLLPTSHPWTSHVFTLLLSGWIPLLPCGSGASLLLLTLHECGGASKPMCCNENPVQPKNPKHSKQQQKKKEKIPPPTPCCLQSKMKWFGWWVKTHALFSDSLLLSSPRVALTARSSL